MRSNPATPSMRRAVRIRSNGRVRISSSAITPPAIGSSMTMPTELTGLRSQVRPLLRFADGAQASQRGGELCTQEALGKPRTQGPAWHLADHVDHHAGRLGLRFELEPGGQARPADGTRGESSWRLEVDHFSLALERFAQQRAAE